MSKFMRSLYFQRGLWFINMPEVKLKLIVHGLFLYFRNPFYVTHGLNSRVKMKILKPAGFAGFFRFFSVLPASNLLYWYPNRVIYLKRIRPFIHYTIHTNSKTLPVLLKPSL